MDKISNNQTFSKTDIPPPISPDHNAKQAPHQIAQDKKVQKSRKTVFAYFNIKTASHQVINRLNMEAPTKYSHLFAEIHSENFNKMVEQRNKMVEQRAIEETKPETQGIPIRQKQLTLFIPKERPLKIKVHALFPTVGKFPTVDKKTKENTSYKKSTNCHRSHLPSVWAPWAKP